MYVYTHMYTCMHLPRERGRGMLKLRVQDIGLTRAYLEVHGNYNLLTVVAVVITQLYLG